jgi:cell wall hydrolase
MNLADPIDVLARTIFGEARGDGAAGMEAVASVVLNRVKIGGWWGGDVIGVCLAKDQLDCWMPGPDLPAVQEADESDPVFQTALDIAGEAVAGTLADTVNGATSYKVTTLPWPHDWGPEVPPVAVVGHQSFYILQNAA